MNIRNINHEKHPSPLHYAEASEKLEINKIIFYRKLLNSRSQSPDWECIVIETLFCVPKVGFGNEINGVGLRNEINGVGLRNEIINGSGFLEAVYQECLEKELDLIKIPFQSQTEIKLSYKNTPLSQTYRADLICYDSILIEIKAVSQILDVHRAQVLNYLRATNLKLGLLVNFSSFPKVWIERIVL